MPKVEQVGRAAEGAVMTEGCGMWPVQTGLRVMQNSLFDTDKRFK